MLLSIMRRLVGKARHRNVTLTLEEKSFIVPHGIMEDVLVKVDIFLYLIDLEVEVHIILGIPFLCTTRENVDLETCEFMLKFKKE